ncbi:MAG: fumarylacetoacetate hydrolase family protein [Muribaculaceae bacterium]|nr:fumarylacetoacetate hydrolase family protein [Muribaculaceae bacterium]
MKIIGIKNGDGRELPQQVYLIADSAVIRNNKPFFVPHFAQAFTGRLALVLHIDRLGKHIAPRFAHRYCLAVAPAIKVTAHNLNLPQSSESNSALANAFDGALLLGDFSPVNEVTGINGTSVTATLNSDNAGTGSLTKMQLDYREIVAKLSTFFTLKMGDLILVEMDTNDFELKPGDTVNASCGALKRLTIRVK